MPMQISKPTANSSPPTETFLYGLEEPEQEFCFTPAFTHNFIKSRSNLYSHLSQTED